MTARPFEPLRLDHLLLHVRGMAEAEAFYCGVLGCTVRQRIPHNAMVELTAGVTLVDIDDPSGAWALEGAPHGRNLDHFALLTRGWDDAEMRSWLATNGVGIEEERNEDDEQSLYVRDPCGNMVELVRRAG
ncbi:MAG TPA: VOC family protein [Sphingomicrobium sp.]|nr:VOC family protein [Sphingomicrobium sp.]